MNVKRHFKGKFRNTLKDQRYQLPEKFDLLINTHAMGS